MAIHPAGVGATTGHPGTALVFISYSRRDADLAMIAWGLLRASGISSWLDTKNIPPGTVWRADITTSVSACSRMLVMWCSHASASSEVESEYEQGLTERKVVVPVLLDDTPLAASLEPLQAEDLRALGRRNHGLARYERWFWAAGLGAAALSWLLTLVS